MFIFVQPLDKLLSRSEILYPFLTVILYTGGYTLLHFKARYLWIVNILLLLMGGKILSELFKTEFLRGNLRKHVLTSVFIISFVITPLKSTIQMSRYNIDREMYAVGTELNSRYDIKGNIASNRLLTHYSWHKTFRLAYW